MKMPWTKSKRAPKRNRFSIRGFAAAQIDRLLSGWRFDGGFTPNEVSTNLTTIRGRSRQMAKDSPHFKKWLTMNATNIVGEGFALKSVPHDRNGGKIVIDKEASKIIEYHWRRFCNYRDPITMRSYFDATGRKTEAEMDRLNVKTWRRDGEYFMHVVRTDANPYGIAFRVLRPDLCDHTYNIADTGRGTIIHCGVELTIEDRIPVAYWFHTLPKNAMAWNPLGYKPVLKIPASQIIHGFTQEDEDQPRGIPMGYASMRKLKMLDMYDEAELTAARDEACSVRTYYAEKGDEEALVDLTDDDSEGAAQALLAEKEPGQSEILPAGWKQDIHTPKHPNKEVTAFKASMLKDVASGLDVEYSGFANDWQGVSFSSVRVGTIAERDAWIVSQNEMISQCKTPQFMLWLNSFLELSISEDLPRAKYDKFAEHAFRGRRWMWVDPMKDMNAAKMARDYGWKTDSQIAEEMGNDFDENLEVINMENEDRIDNNVPAPPRTGQTGIAVSVSNGEKEDEEEEK